MIDISLKIKKILKNTKSFLIKRPYLFVVAFVVVGLLTLLITRAYSLLTKSVSINLTGCSTSVRCFDGAVTGTNSIALNGSGGSTGSCTTGNRFNIVGQQIIDPNCKVFIPMGANIAVTPGYTFNWNGTANGHVADVKAWGWNTIRLTAVCVNANGTNDMNGFYAGIDSVISEYTSQKVVVMLECHDFTGKNPTDPSSIYPFLDRMTQKYAGNQYVWFNPINEPYTGTSSAEITGWMNLQTTLLNRVRQYAAYNIFVADIPGYGQGVDSFKGTSSITRLGSGKCNVMYAWHDYGAVSSDYNTNNSESTNRAAQLDMFNYLQTNKIPVVIGEIGDPLTLNEGTAGPPQWNRWGAYASMDYGPSRGTGILWWHATGDSGNFLTYSLMADRHQAPWSAASSGSGTSAGGQKYWQITHPTAPGGQAFAGDISQSNCR